MIGIVFKIEELILGSGFDIFHEEFIKFIFFSSFFIFKKYLLSDINFFILDRQHNESSFDRNDCLDYRRTCGRLENIPVRWGEVSFGKGMGKPEVID